MRLQRGALMRRCRRGDGGSVAGGYSQYSGIKDFKAEKKNSAKDQSYRTGTALLVSRRPVPVQHTRLRPTM